MYLDHDRLDQLIQAIRDHEIQPDEYDAWTTDNQQELMAILHKTKVWLSHEEPKHKVWRSVYYRASY